MRLALLLVLSVIAAGCAAPPGPDVPAAAPAAVLAAPCDDARAALAHLGNGTFGLAPAAMCVFGTKLVGSENTLGICRKTGAVYAGMAFSGNIGGLARSLDGGASWEYVEPALAGQKPHATTLDPYVYVDPVTCRVFLDNLLTVNCSLLSWSDDAGETWSHSAAGCGEFDHQSLFAGPPVRSATVGYPHVVYRCAIHAVALAGASTSTTCQRSLDGGLTWLPPGAPAYGPNPFGRGHNGVMGACDGAAGHGIVDAQGRVYLPKGWCGQPWLAWSDDEGLTWTRAQVAGLGMAAGADG
ncbi:MAG TPA: sialidase family protein, partial [Candidatus Thermoplasmatota archaeon]|nr:sialidase family protein [Candidatus Thermoplasmatota archaeon]